MGTGIRGLIELSGNRLADDDGMKYCLIDRIVELSRGERIVAVKAVSLAEEYLADHFPKFPVLPGVLMLEALAEAATWLVHESQDFTSPVILLRYAKNVTFKSFVRPGRLLTLDVTCRRLKEDESDFEGVGRCEDVDVVRARFGLIHRWDAKRHGAAPMRQTDEAAGAARARLAYLRR